MPDLTRNLAERPRESVSSSPPHSSSLSHELRTPLTAIRLQLDQVILDCDTLSPNLHKVFNRLDAACARMIGLVESLLQHARIQGGKIVVESERFAVERVVVETIQELQALADQKGLALEFEAIGQHVIDSDPHVLRLVLSNLIQNAIKFTSKGTVSVSVRNEGGEIAIAVADSGP